MQTTLSRPGVKRQASLVAVSQDCDPYLRLSVPSIDQSQSCKFVEKTRNPDWNELLTFSGVVAPSILEIQVMDHDTIGRDDEIGHLDFDLASLVPGEESDVWLDITHRTVLAHDSGNTHSGRLNLKLTIWQDGTLAANCVSGRDLCAQEKSSFHTWVSVGFQGMSAPAEGAVAALAAGHSALNNLALGNVEEGAIFLSKNKAQIKDDASVVLAAVTACPRVLRMVDSKFLENRPVVMAALNQDGSMLKYVNHSLQSDRHVVIVAAGQFGQSVKHASAELRVDAEVMSRACRPDGWARHGGGRAGGRADDAHGARARLRSASARAVESLSADRYRHALNHTCNRICL